MSKRYLLNVTYTTASGVRKFISGMSIKDGSRILTDRMSINEKYTFMLQTYMSKFPGVLLITTEYCNIKRVCLVEDQSDRVNPIKTVMEVDYENRSITITHPKETMDVFGIGPVEVSHYVMSDPLPAYNHINTGLRTHRSTPPHRNKNLDLT